MRFTINKNANVFAEIFLVVFIVAKTMSLPDLLANFLIASSGLLCLAWLVIKQINISRWILVTFFLTILMFISILVNGNASYYELIWTWSYMGVALLFTKSEINSFAIERVYFLVMAIFAFDIVTGVNPQNALSSGSGNNIATYVLFYVILLYMKRYEEGKKIILWPCITAVLFAIWGNGRAGLLASITLAILVISYRFIFEKKGKVKTLIIIVILILSARFILFHYMGEYINTFIYKMNRYGTESIRTAIWGEYFQKITSNLIYLIFGAPTMDCHWASLYNGNLHNAFLVAHAKYGLIVFIYIVYSMLQVSCRFIKKKNGYLIIFVMVWFIRSMFDWTGFPGIFDVLFWYFVIKAKEPNRFQGKRSYRDIKKSKKIIMQNNILHLYKKDIFKGEEGEKI